MEEQGKRQWKNKERGSGGRTRKEAVAEQGKRQWNEAVEEQGKRQWKNKERQ